MTGGSEGLLAGARDDTARQARYGRGVRVFAGFLSLMLAFAVLEVGLRIGVQVMPTTFGAAIDVMPESKRIYGLKPNLPEPVVTNSFGFRGREVSLQKPPGVFRIVMLGDSITFGNSVAWNETFSYFLEETLNRTDGPVRFEVLNLGVSGYNTEQELATLRELGLQFTPDLVVLNVCLNDSDPPKELVRAGLKNRTAITRLSDINTRTIVASSYVLTMLKQSLVSALRQQDGMLRALNSPKLFLDTRVREAAWGQMKARVADLAQTARATGIPFVAVVYPYSSQIRLSPDKRIPQLDLAAFFEREGIAALDAADFYRKDDPDMFVDGYVHLSGKGHAVIARAIGDFLRQQGLLPVPAGHEQG